MGAWPPGGSTIVVLEADRHVPTDLAAQAARCALALRAIAGPRATAGPRRIALAMGRAESTSALHHGEAINRASRLLSRLPPAQDGPPPIALEEVSAGLLDAPFDITEREDGLWLHRERPVLQGARTLRRCSGRNGSTSRCAEVVGSGARGLQSAWCEDPESRPDPSAFCSNLLVELRSPPALTPAPPAGLRRDSGIDSALPRRDSCWT